MIKNAATRTMLVVSDIAITVRNFLKSQQNENPLPDSSRRR
jgi:hypothetical protein